MKTFSKKHLYLACRFLLFSLVLTGFMYLHVQIKSFRRDQGNINSDLSSKITEIESKTSEKSTSVPDTETAVENSSEGGNNESQDGIYGEKRFPFGVYESAECSSGSFVSSFDYSEEEYSVDRMWAIRSYQNPINNGDEIECHSAKLQNIQQGIKNNFQKEEIPESLGFFLTLKNEGTLEATYSASDFSLVTSSSAVLENAQALNKDGGIWHNAKLAPGGKVNIVVYFKTKDRDSGTLRWSPQEIDHNTTIDYKFTKN